MLKMYLSAIGRWIVSGNVILKMSCLRLLENAEEFMSFTFSVRRIRGWRTTAPNDKWDVTKCPPFEGLKAAGPAWPADQ